jgi:type IV secretory pathway VirB2 component (pilin)
MRILWRAALVLAVYILVGLVAAHAVTAHAQAVNSSPAQARLVSWMAGLFAGGIAALITLIAVWKRGG